MDKEIYPVGTKLMVTKDHDVTWTQPWPRAGDVLTVRDRHAMPHSYGARVDIYVTESEAGDRVLVQENLVTRYVEPFAVGARVFVTETHSTSKSTTNYAGTHLVIFMYVSAETAKHGRAFYWTTRVEDEALISVYADKVALVESEPKKLTPPVAPSYVGKQGEVVWQEKDTELGGYWTYDNYWGWSNFVPVKADLYRTPVKGEDMRVNGTLATSALDGTVQAV